MRFLQKIPRIPENPLPQEISFRCRTIVGEYKYGIIDECHTGTDGKIRSATIRYRNASEGVNRTTKRAVRSLVIIHRVDEIDLMEELGQAALEVDGYYLLTKDGL